MKSVSKEKRDRLILIAVGTVVIVAAVWYGFIGQQKRNLEKMAREFAEERQKVSNAEHLIRSGGEIQQNLDAAASQLRKIESRMASGDMYSWVISTINQFKEGRRVDIPQFSPAVSGEVGLLPKFPYRAATFNLRGTAYFHDLGKFIADFENSFPYLRVQNLELEPAAHSAATAGDDSELLIFKIEVVTLVNPNTL